MPSLFDPTDYDEDIKAGPELSDIWKSVKDAWGGMNNWERTSVASSVMPPVIGDVVGVGADIGNMIDNPEARTWSNAGWTALGALPFVPSGLGWIKTTNAKNLSQADQLGATKAQELVTAGAPRQQLYDESGGWMLSPEGTLYKWEPDVEATFDPMKLPEKQITLDAKNAGNKSVGDIVTARQGRLGDALDHPEFYAAYPQVAETQLTLYPHTMPGAAAWNAKHGVDIFNVDPNVWQTGNEFYDPSYALQKNQDLHHELVHVTSDIDPNIQVGSSADNIAVFSDQLGSGTPYFPEVDDVMNRIDQLKEMRIQRMRDNPQAFKNITKEKVQLDIWYNKELNQAKRNKMDKLLKNSLDELYQKKLNALIERTDPAISKIDDELRRLKQSVSSSGKIEMTGNDMYTRHFGEVLADANEKQITKSIDEAGPLFNQFRMPPEQQLSFDANKQLFEYVKDLKHTYPSLFD